MKRVFVLIFFAPLMATAQKKLTIAGAITGLKEASRISITDMNRASDTIGKGTVKNGVFTIKGVLKEPTLLSLNLDGTKKIPLFLESGLIKISGNIKEVQKLNVRGSNSQAVFELFQKKFNPLFEQLGKLNQQMQLTGRTDSLEFAMNNARDNIQQAIDIFIAKYKSSPVSSFLLAVTIQLNDDILLTEKRINSLKPSALENMYGVYLKETIAEKKFTAIGSTAMDFTQADTSGHPVALSSFRGKYVLLDFWASWCGPCRQENPNVVNNFNKFKEKNFTVLGVSLDRPGQKEKWLQAIHADNLTWTHVSDLQFWNNAVAQQYRVQSIPQNLLIDPDGKIVAKDLRGPALESKLCELLGCN
jgi:peroxiredoxin